MNELKDKYKKYIIEYFNSARETKYKEMFHNYSNCDGVNCNNCIFIRSKRSSKCLYNSTRCKTLDISVEGIERLMRWIRLNRQSNRSKIIRRQD